MESTGRGSVEPGDDGDAAARSAVTAEAKRGWLSRLRIAVQYRINRLFLRRYERYLHSLLVAYLPQDALAADAILDAMCGRTLPNLKALRRIFPRARRLCGTDIDISPKYPPPHGTSVFAADLCSPLPVAEPYDLVLAFKPPSGELEEGLRAVLRHLLDVLAPAGHLLLVLAEEDKEALAREALCASGAAVLACEANRLRGAFEPEHRWVIVARAPTTTDAPR